MPYYNIPSSTMFKDREMDQYLLAYHRARFLYHQNDANARLYAAHYVALHAYHSRASAPVSKPMIQVQPTAARKVSCRFLQSMR